MEASTTTLRKTPLHAVHREMGAKMVPFGGWEMPVEYAGLITEHMAVRRAAGLFDVSHMGELEVSGPGALAFLQRVTCNDVARLMRRTPAASSSATVKDLPRIPTMKLNGFESAEQTERTEARSGSPGAISTSAPALSNACRRRIVSSRFGLPRMKFSARAVSVKGNERPRAASTAAATRSVA